MSAAPSRPPAPATPAEIDASGRGPLLLLFACAALWLLAASGLGLMASIKFHAPGMLADHGWQTYGRLLPAATNALVYGFALPAGFGVALWVLARLGRVRLAAPGLVILGTVLWNVGVKLGILTVLRGSTTGFELLEMSRYTWPVLFTAYALIGIAGLLTFQRRQTQELYPSQWFLLAALFWFPWIYSAANVLLTCVPVRGVMQAVVGWWFVSNLQTVCLGFLGLGAALYFIPKLLGRPLHSLYLAMFAFWSLALFGGWTGVAPGSPVPAWMPTLSTLAALVMLIPIAAIAINGHKTFGGQYSLLAANPPLAFIVLGFFAWIAAGVLGAVLSVREVSNVTHFTWLEPGVTRLFLLGFFAMTMLGAIYTIVPRLVQSATLNPRWIRLHFWLAAVGVTLLFVPLALAGLRQGLALANPAIAFTDTMKVTLPYLRASTMGDLLLVAGNLLLVANLARMFLACARAAGAPVWRTLTTPQPRPAEVSP